ncbi:TetR/AcrR family transcriptional regulator [Rhabdothermincola salaria]|uniref:TetR/AcrR family transcriptional regulator n=1 Tax=Rhabdothermincola salaria TaxID=2903142 RepID=UPI001E5A2039|nr:TetR/AcrR family transcriptional regulator [Rhabdothermincola salaria]MCD9625348.1 TetR/AcrR family transcriptional regulator [Rhabdothermincola salaria]
MTLASPTPEDVAGAPATDDDTTPRVDGRRARAERSRQAIADALLSLVEGGDLRPTAGRIAQRAGISERLIYHHFADLDELLRVVAERQLARARARMAPLDPVGTRAERIAAIVDQRAELFEWITPIRRASNLQEPFSADLREVRARSNAELRAHTAALFSAELDETDRAEHDELLAALDVTLSWPTWNTLRESGLDPTATRQTLARMVHALLDG